MMKLALEDWRCPTCLDLLFKPAVNTPCGHIYCYWCLHKAMSPYSPSACPICRTKYAHLPAICAKLHCFLSCQFPEQYALRRQETEAEERECSSSSPDPEAGGPLPPPPGPNSWQPLHFACDSPACGKLLCRPAVLTCGHAVCSLTCLPVRCGDGGSGSGECHLVECPACGLAARQQPAECKQLGDLLAELFPEEARQREQECQQELQLQQEAGTGMHEQAHNQPLPQQQEQQATADADERRDPATPRASAAASAAGSVSGATESQQPVAESPASTSDQQQEQQQQALSPSLVSALRRRQAAGGAGAELAQRLEASLRDLSGDGYVHHGVGCDGCGLYPIQGRRYRCLDCPDAMGFDLCGPCVDRGLSNIVGRFNQRHTPEHRMRLVRPRVTAMHMLQAANPGMPMEQLLWLLELTLTGGDDEQQQQQQPPDGRRLQEGQEGPAAVDEAQAGEAGARGAGPRAAAAAAAAPLAGVGGATGHTDGSGGPDFALLRRGPRPAYDATAQEPSPSAYASQEAVAAAAARGEAQGLIHGSDEDGEEEVHVRLDDVLGRGGARS